MNPARNFSTANSFSPLGVSGGVAEMNRKVGEPQLERERSFQGVVVPDDLVHTSSMSGKFIGGNCSSGGARNC